MSRSLTNLLLSLDPDALKALMVAGLVLAGLAKAVICVIYLIS